jgi:hypothetical protein
MPDTLETRRQTGNQAWPPEGERRALVGEIDTVRRLMEAYGVGATIDQIHKDLMLRACQRSRRCARRLSAVMVPHA